VSRRAIIEIELLSEAVFGGDGSPIGTADIEIQTDECGLPYLAGRTLKGLLREQAEWYNHFLPPDERLDGEIARLFGEPWEDNHEALRIGSAKLADAIYDFARRHKLGPADMLEAVTHIRSMTSIDETGKAAEGTLRQARVVKPGFVFYASVFAASDLTEKEKLLLEKAVKLLRHVGLMRNRGKGEVRCRLKWLDGRDSVVPAGGLERADSEPGAKGAYMELTIFAHEPLKISQVLGTSDSSQALGHIPGSVLRGALVQAYLQATGKPAEELETEDIFDPRKVQFWNGYLVLDGKRGLPFAQHLFETKADSKLPSKTRKIHQVLDRERFAAIRHQSPVRISRDVMAFGAGRLLAGNVRTTSSLHLSLLEDARREGRFARLGGNRTRIYRYEALAAGQVFRAVVFARESSPFTEWLSRQRTMMLWLGGARNSGYGRVSIAVKPLAFSPEWPDWSKKHTGFLYVLAASDWILRDRQGKPCSHLDPDWLGEQLGVELELEDQVVQTRLTGGYISQWQAYQPSHAAVQAGSIYKYRVLSGILDERKMKQLMDRGVGARINEGYGRLVLFEDWPFDELADWEPADAGNGSMESRGEPCLFEEGRVSRGDPATDDGQIDRIRKRLAQLRLEEIVRERVNRWIGQVHGERVGKSKWGTLWQISSELLAGIQAGPFAAETVIDRWTRFWEDVDRRTENKRNRGLNGVRVGQWSLKEFIFRVLEHEYSIDDWLRSDGISPYWNLRELELFFRQIVRGQTATGKKVSLS
jgi:CRISPR-associated protein Csx10